MKILAVAAHPDDEILGCGATLKKLRNAGHEVFACVLCAPADARFNRPELERLNAIAMACAEKVGISEIQRHDFRNIRFNVVPHIEMVQAIESAILRFRPDWIFTHHPADLNIDHRICYETTMAATMLPQRLSSELSPTQIKRVLLFEVLSSTDWAPPMTEVFRPNLFVDVSDTFEDKIGALEAFEGAMKPFPHSRSLQNVRNLAELRGAQVGLRAAEAFQVVRDILL